MESCFELRWSGFIEKFHQVSISLYIYVTEGVIFVLVIEYRMLPFKRRFTVRRILIMGSNFDIMSGTPFSCFINLTCIYVISSCTWCTAIDMMSSLTVSSHKSRSLSMGLVDFSFIDISQLVSPSAVGDIRGPWDYEQGRWMLFTYRRFLLAVLSDWPRNHVHSVPLTHVTTTSKVTDRVSVSVDSLHSTYLECYSPLLDTTSHLRFLLPGLKNSNTYWIVMGPAKLRVVKRGGRKRI